MSAQLASKCQSLGGSWGDKTQHKQLAMSVYQPGHVRQIPQCPDIGGHARLPESHLSLGTDGVSLASPILYAIVSSPAPVWQDGRPQGQKMARCTNVASPQ